MTTCLTPGLFLILLVSAAAASEQLSQKQVEALTPFLGWYQGAFDTALTADPIDDMNINSCADCELHADPLTDIFLQLTLDSRQLRPGFHRDRDTAQFDLLGKYCQSEIGELKDFAVTEGQGKTSGEDYRVLRATFAFDAGRCPRNITQNKEPELSLEIMHNRDQGSHIVRVEIDKDLRRMVTLTAKNRDGERVPVKSNPADYGKDRRQQRSFLYEDEQGEFSRARSDQTETRSFAIPIIFGGYVGTNVSWWPHKILDVESETEQVLTRHTGIFFPVAD